MFVAVDLRVAMFVAIDLIVAILVAINLLIAILVGLIAAIGLLAGLLVSLIVATGLLERVRLNFATDLMPGRVPLVTASSGFPLVKLGDYKAARGEISRDR